MLCILQEISDCDHEITDQLMEPRGRDTRIHKTHSQEISSKGAQWLSGRVLDSRPRGCWFEPHRRHCPVSLTKNINPSLVLVQPRKTRPFIT